MKDSGRENDQRRTADRRGGQGIRDRAAWREWARRTRNEPSPTHAAVGHDGVVPVEPASYRTVTPRIAVSDVGAQVEFLRAVFDAVGDVPAGRPAEVVIGDSLIMIGSTDERAAFPAFLYVYVADADDTYQRAMDAGAMSLEAPLDTPYGDRRAMVRDPFGNVFQIATRSS